MTIAFSPSADARLDHLGVTVFTTFSALATELGAVNLGQGSPSGGPPPGMVEVARASVGVGFDQYPVLAGLPELRAAIVADRLRTTGVHYDPDTEVLVTVGATEALTAAILALAGRGDEVVVLEPAYDSYAAAVDLAGADLVPVPLLISSEGRFVPDFTRLESAITHRTRVVVINTPHNPSGTVLTHDEIACLAEVLDRAPHVLLLSDEVYEHLALDPVPHLSPTTVARLRDRTLAVSSAGKTFSVTGWKIGWVVGPAELVSRVRSVKQFLTFSVNAPFQRAVAYALDSEWEWVANMRSSLRERRDILHTGLQGAGFIVFPAQAGYFLLARPSWPPSDQESALTLAHNLGVVAIPGSAFHRRRPAEGGAAELLRFAFCGDEVRIRAALRRLLGLWMQETT